LAGGAPAGTKLGWSAAIVDGDHELARPGFVANFSVFKDEISLQPTCQEFFGI
jgi:hypothetical protein